MRFPIRIMVAGTLSRMLSSTGRPFTSENPRYALRDKVLQPYGILYVKRPVQAEILFYLLPVFRPGPRADKHLGGISRGEGGHEQKGDD